MRKKVKSATKKKKLFSHLLIAIGLLLIIVPSVITYLNSKRNANIIDDFLNQSQRILDETETLEREEIEPFYIPESLMNSNSNFYYNSDSNSNANSNSNSSEIYTSDEQLNNSTHNLQTEQSSQTVAKKPLMSREEIEKRMTGVLIIEKIDLRMIIMDGSDEETLRVAAGRIPGTGKIDEIGNCVLAGHRNYTFGKYFNRLDELEIGDEIIIQIPEKTLKYEVYDKRIVEPDDISVAEQSETDKILTLYTCHPVAIASHRLVIHARQLDD